MPPFFVIVRGPLGVGKTTVARRLAEAVGAEYVSIDEILDQNEVLEWDGQRITERCFIRVNEVAAPRALMVLRKGGSVVFDGNFYYQSQLHDLLLRLPYLYAIFTLSAPLEVCKLRDQDRPRSYGSDATEAVFRLNQAFVCGTVVDATGSAEEVVAQVLPQLMSLVADPPSPSSGGLSSGPSSN